jgi:divalent metal cation (Fe/Co/Zn/Cd) transporter
MHQHNHEHNVLTSVGLVLLVVSFLEIGLGLRYGVGPVVSDGAEKFSDGMVAILSGSLLDTTEQLFGKHHWVRHNLRPLTNALVYGLAILFVGLVGLLESIYGGHNSPAQAAIGAASFVVIFSLATWLHYHARGVSNRNRHETYVANATHLYQDSLASAGIVAAAVLGLLGHPRACNIAVSVAILIWISVHNFPQIMRLFSEMHSEANCDEPSDHPAH